MLVSPAKGIGQRSRECPRSIEAKISLHIALCPNRNTRKSSPILIRWPKQGCLQAKRQRKDKVCCTVEDHKQMSPTIRWNAYNKGNVFFSGDTITASVVQSSSNAASSLIVTSRVNANSKPSSLKRMKLVARSILKLLRLRRTRSTTVSRLTQPYIDLQISAHSSHAFSVAFRAKPSTILFHNMLSDANVSMQSPQFHNVRLLARPKMRRWSLPSL